MNHECKINETVPNTKVIVLLKISIKATRVINIMNVT